MYLLLSGRILLFPASENIGALIVCLRRSQTLQILNKVKSSDTSTELWKGVVPIKHLKNALCHSDDQVCKPFTCC